MAKVTIYTTTMCPWCHRAKEFFNENKVKYEERNVEKNPSWAQEMIDRSGQTGVPVIDVDGQIIVGYNEPALRKALKLA
ncbi:glutaredoxin family protein [Candidatus Micrarchaeota archaeon]|nr:glutaredoxin family protein [Candidatus Micrarchaeota archaeon]